MKLPKLLDVFFKTHLFCLELARSGEQTSERFNYWLIIWRQYENAATITR
jgi:hypothetical protein